MKKTKIAFDELERRILVKLLYEKHNVLLRAGEPTDAIDKLTLKSWGDGVRMTKLIKRKLV